MSEGEQPRRPVPTAKPPPRRTRTPGNSDLLEASPWLPPQYDIADASAMQALARGDASPDMQRRALAWIINRAADTYGFPYRPGANDRDTNVAPGRQFVGQQIVKLLHVNTAALRRTEPNADLAEG